MTQICKRCNWEVLKLDLSEEQRLDVLGLMNQGLKLFAIQKLRQSLNIDLISAKAVVSHLNSEYGNCVRCNYEHLIEENGVCPKCKAFNYNLKIDSVFNKEFCSELESRINFNELEREELKGFWCDGINHMPRSVKSLAVSNLDRTKIIVTNAWLGKDGQEKFEMTIRFGNQSVTCYKQNQSLSDCIPTSNSREWVKIDLEERQIEISLN